MSNIPQALFESSNTSILKRKLTAGALGIFFGSFGAHKFYLGKTFWGVLYYYSAGQAFLLLSVL